MASVPFLPLGCSRGLGTPNLKTFTVWSARCSHSAPPLAEAASCSLQCRAPAQGSLAAPAPLFLLPSTVTNQPSLTLSFAIDCDKPAQPVPASSWVGPGLLRSPEAPPNEALLAALPPCHPLSLLGPPLPSRPSPPSTSTTGEAPPGRLEPQAQGQNRVVQAREEQVTGSVRGQGVIRGGPKDSLDSLCLGKDRHLVLGGSTLKISHISRPRNVSPLHGQAKARARARAKRDPHSYVTLPIRGYICHRHTRNTRHTSHTRHTRHTSATASPCSAHQGLCGAAPGPKHTPFFLQQKMGPPSPRSFLAPPPRAGPPALLHRTHSPLCSALASLRTSSMRTRTTEVR